MTIKAKVVNRFKENAHDGHVYKAGDIYPAEGFEATEERVSFLTNVHEKYKKIYLADVVRDEEEKGKQPDGEQDTEFPKHVGGGTYELSNGEKVKGKEEAQEAEDALNETNE